MCARKKTPDILGNLMNASPEAAPTRPSAPAPEPAPQTGPEPASRPEAEKPGQSPPLKMQFVSFKLGRELFALPLESVERALRMVAPIRLPEAPPWIMGVINMQGEVVPILDLAQRFGSPPRQPRADQRLLVINQRPRKLALLVDRVERVLGEFIEGLEAPTGHLADSRILAGVIRENDELTMVIDPDRLAPEDWRRENGLWARLEDQAAAAVKGSNE